MVFGPTRRMPLSRQAVTMRLSRAFPASPVSLNPEVITTTALTPFSLHPPRTSSTVSAGVQMMARSTGSEISGMRRYTGRPKMTSSLGLTGKTLPLNCPATMLLNTI